MNTTKHTTLDINELEPIYFVNECDIDRDVFLPIFVSADFVSCMMGYFTSKSIKELAVSLSQFLKSENAVIELVVSPNIDVEDLGAIKNAINAEENLIPFLFPDFKLTEDNLKTRCVAALAYLIAKKKLRIKIGLQERGLFHTKCWLFHTENGWLSVHGSVNMTGPGLSTNTEQLVIDKEWEGDRSKRVVDKIRDTYTQIWEGTYKNVITIELNRKTVNFLNECRKTIIEPDNWHDYIDYKLLREQYTTQTIERKLKIPGWLNYQSGKFSHQGEAVREWMNNEEGILSIATGGGKTLTSLVAAALMTNKVKHLFVVVSVPTITLLRQWVETVSDFGVEAVSLQGKTLAKIRKEIRECTRRLRHGISINEVIVTTHDSLKQNVYQLIQGVNKKVPVMLIGDEVHNLGSKGFVSVGRDGDKPRFRMGLSATYDRQFDDEGTKFLIDYFGDLVYEFPLSKAIGKCLVPFDYIIHSVSLDETEQDEWSDLTYQIRKLSYTANLQDGNPSKERWKLLCLKRRRIIEAASAKVCKFGEVLPKLRNELRRALVFCTDKEPEQLIRLNRVLESRSINFHQVTHQETMDKGLTNKIVDSFERGELQVLTSKRVLDEGFNVRQAEVAYILASNTVRRQWIQRLGRILRLSPETNKSKATIHDFVVFPALEEGESDPDLRSMVAGEFGRISFFSELADNQHETDGALDTMHQLIELMR